MGSMMIEAVIFDCDGTLVDSEQLGNEVLVDFVAEFGLRIPVAEAVAEFSGGKMATTIAEIQRRLGRPLPADFVPRLRRRMAVAFRDRLRPMDGAAELLRSLTIPFGIASSGPREKIVLSLTVTGLIEFFDDRIFSAYEIDCFKPDPGLFLHAARAMGVSPEHCAVVEDSRFGIEAGLAAGMRVFAFRPEHCKPEPAPEVRVVRHLSELSDLLP